MRLAYYGNHILKLVIRLLSSRLYDAWTVSFDNKSNVVTLLKHQPQLLKIAFSLILIKILTVAVLKSAI